MLVIRFSRVGRKNKPQFRLVVQEHTATPTGKHVEIVGSWDPNQKKGVFKNERIEYWLSKGAQASDTVHNLLVSQEIIKGNKIKIKMSKKKTEGEGEEGEGGEASKPASDGSGKEDGEKAVEGEEKKEEVEGKAPAEEVKEEKKEEAPKESQSSADDGTGKTKEEAKEEETSKEESEK